MTTEKPEKVIGATRIVPAGQQEIFDLLADPKRHAELDGSNSVQELLDAPARLSLGAKFTMKMRMGVPYRMTNEVVEFEEPSLIAWRHMGRHVWRYRLREVETGTEVTEEFDWGPSPAPAVLRAMGAPRRNATSIEKTLEQLVERFS